MADLTIIDHDAQCEATYQPPFGFTPCECAARAARAAVETGTRRRGPAHRADVDTDDMFAALRPGDLIRTQRTGRQIVGIAHHVANGAWYTAEGGLLARPGAEVEVLARLQDPPAPGRVVFTGSHPDCWTGDHYEHRACAVPSRTTCVVDGCLEGAGTLWGPNFCPAHDVERLDRITRNLESFAAGLGDGGR